MQKSERDSKGKPLRLLSFWDKSIKPGQIQSCKFFLSLFDQVWFRTRVIKSSVVRSTVESRFSGRKQTTLCK